MLMIRRITPQQLMLVLVIVALILAGGAFCIFVLDQREKNAITSADVFTALDQGDMSRIVTCLKAKPALVNARDQNGQTPLHVAAQKEMKDTALLLLNMGADPTLKDPQGKTPADIAKQKGATSLAELLQNRPVER